MLPTDQKLPPHHTEIVMRLAPMLLNLSTTEALVHFQSAIITMIEKTQITMPSMESQARILLLEMEFIAQRMCSVMIIGRFCLRDDLSVLEEYVPFRKGVDFRRMGDDHNGPPFVVELHEELHDLVSGLAVKCAGRLIAKQDERIRDEGSRYGDALLLSSRELARERVQLVFQSDLHEGFDCHLIPLPIRHSLIDEREHHLFDGGSLPEKIVILEDESDILPPNQCLVVIIELRHVS